jgi:hypothetical protein
MKYQPTAHELHRIRLIRKKYEKDNPTGVSQEHGFKVLGTYPLSVMIEMEKLHGANWQNNPRLLVEFMQKNPHYRVANPDA